MVINTSEYNGSRKKRYGAYYTPGSKHLPPCLQELTSVELFEIFGGQNDNKDNVTRSFENRETFADHNLHGKVFARDGKQIKEDLKPGNVIGSLEFHLEQAGYALIGTSENDTKKCFSKPMTYIRPAMIHLVNRATKTFLPLLDEDVRKNTNANNVRRLVLKGQIGIGKSVSTLLLMDLLPGILPYLKNDDAGFIVNFWSTKTGAFGTMPKQSDSTLEVQYIIVSPGHREGRTRMFLAKKPNKALIMDNFLRIDDGAAYAVNACHGITSTSISGWAQTNTHNSAQVPKVDWMMPPWSIKDCVLSKYVLHDILRQDRLSWSEFFRRMHIAGGQVHALFTDTPEYMFACQGTTHLSAIIQMVDDLMAKVADRRDQHIILEALLFPQVAANQSDKVIVNDTLFPFAPQPEKAHDEESPLDLECPSYNLSGMDLSSNKTDRAGMTVRIPTSKLASNLIFRRACKRLTKLQLSFEPTEKGVERVPVGKKFENMIRDRFDSEDYAWDFLTLHRINTGPYESRPEEIRRILDVTKGKVRCAHFNKYDDIAHVGPEYYFPKDKEFTLLTTNSDNETSVDMILLHRHLDVLYVYFLQATLQPEHSMSADAIDSILRNLQPDVNDHAFQCERVEPNIVYCVPYLSEFKDHRGKRPGFHFNATDEHAELKVKDSLKFAVTLNKTKAWKLSIPMHAGLEWSRHPEYSCEMAHTYEIPVEGLDRKSYGDPKEFAQVFGGFWRDRMFAQYFREQMEEEAATDPNPDRFVVHRNATLLDEYEDWKNEAKKVRGYSQVLSLVEAAQKERKEKKERRERFRANGEAIPDSDRDRDADLDHLWDGACYPKTKAEIDIILKGRCICKDLSVGEFPELLAETYSYDHNDVRAQEKRSILQDVESDPLHSNCKLPRKWMKWIRAYDDQIDRGDVQMANIPEQVMHAYLTKDRRPLSAKDIDDVVLTDEDKKVKDLLKRAKGIYKSSLRKRKAGASEDSESPPVKVQRHSPQPLDSSADSEATLIYDRNDL